MPRSLVIGYGNPLRRDDGFGVHIAERVAAWARADVRAIAVHQLAPELAAELSEADRVLFVDAAVQNQSPGALTDDAFTVTRVDVAAAVVAGPSFSHFAAPRELLALSQQLYDRQPEAWLMTAPVEDLSYGDGLSASLQQRLAVAIRQVEAWVTATPDTP